MNAILCQLKTIKKIKTIAHSAILWNFSYFTCPHSSCSISSLISRDKQGPFVSCSAHFNWDFCTQSAKFFLVFLADDQNSVSFRLKKVRDCFHIYQMSSTEKIPYHTPYVCDYITDDYLLYCVFLQVLVSSLHYKEHLILGNIILGLFLFLWYQKWSMENEEKQKRGFNYRGQSIKFSHCELRLCIYATNFGNLC